MAFLGEKIVDSLLSTLQRTFFMFSRMYFNFKIRSSIFSHFAQYNFFIFPVKHLMCSTNVFSFHRHLCLRVSFIIILTCFVQLESRIMTLHPDDFQLTIYIFFEYIFLQYFPLTFLLFVIILTISYRKIQSKNDFFFHYSIQLYTQLFHFVD